MGSASLLAGLATEDTANAVLQKTTDLLTAVTGQASPTAAQIAAAIKDVQPNDYALQTTLAAILTKLVVAPATDASVQSVVTNTTGLGTQTTLAAILAKLPSSPATDTPHSTTTAATAVAGTGLTGGQTATDAVLLNALINMLGSSSGLPHVDSAAILSKLSSDPATQTTLAAVLTALNSGVPHTDQTTLLGTQQGAAPSTVVAGSGLTASQANTSLFAAVVALMNVMGTSSGLPHTDSAAILSKLSGDPATQTTLAAVLAKLPSSPATDTPHSTTAAATAVAGSGLSNGQTATDAQLLNAILNLLGSSSGLPHTDSAAILAKLSSDPATQTTLSAVLSKLSSDPATQTTLAAVLTAVGLGTGGFAKLEDAASAAGDRGIAMFAKRGLTTPTADVDAAGDYLTPMADQEGRFVVQQGAIPDLTWQAYAVVTAAATSSALAAARGTGIRNYLKTLFISASQPSTAVAHIVTVLDGSTVIFRRQIPAAVDSATITFEPPLRGSAATALNVQISAANSAGTAVTATGWQGL